MHSEIETAIAAKKANTTEFSHLLERWYAKLDYPVHIDFQRENFGYMFPLFVASDPKSDPNEWKIPEPQNLKTPHDIFLFWIARMDCQSIPFDKTKWDSLPKNSPYRYRMLKGYLQSVQIPGLPAARLYEQLGRPNSQTNNSFRYELGPNVSTIAPSSFLHITFATKNGTVESYDIQSD